MASCESKSIVIYQGFGTRWDDNDLITVKIESEIDISGFSAEFLLGNIKKTYEDISDGFVINFAASETGTLPIGPISGTLILIDKENNQKPFSTEIPFLVKDWVDGDIKLDGFDITLDTKIQDNILKISIQTASLDQKTKQYVDGKISEHNTSEQAHQFIQGLISQEKTDRIEADGILQGQIDTITLSIPTVNNSTITITQGGVTKGSFTLNQASGDTIALDAGSGNVKTNDLFDYKWTDYLLNDQNWLRVDTFSWQDGTTYSDAYNHLVSDISDVSPSTETVGSYTITYYQASDGHKIVLANQETTVSNIYTESGVAWYYILDTTNTRFKLPRENPAREELIQIIRAKGNGISLGMTDGTNNFGTNIRLSGATARSYMPDENIYGSAIGSSSTTSTAGIANSAIGVTLDSTKSGIISDTADSTSIYRGRKYLYFYVGQFSQSATEQTAGLNAELFNGKVDLNLNNMNPSTTAKQTIASYGMPDYSSGIDISAYSASTSQFSSTANGWVYLAKNTNAKFYINGVDMTPDPAGTTTKGDTCFIALPKSATFYFTGTVAKAEFYPCLGG